MQSLSQNLNLQGISNPSLTANALSEALQERDLLVAVYGNALLDLLDPATPASVLEMCFNNMCGTFVPRLVEELVKRGIKSIAATSADESGTYHIYAVLNQSDGLVLLDPSIGQYVFGYRGIYSGDRESLRTYINSGDTKLHCHEENREKLFLKLWGDQSMTAFTTPKLKISQT